MTAQHSAAEMAVSRIGRLVCVLALLMCPGCYVKVQSPVLLITIDTLRPDRLSCYGYAARKTPAIDSLAVQGALFEEAVCDVPWTTSSMASVMTGTYATRHGLRRNTQRLADSRLTLAEVLKQHGYLTGAVIGSFPLASLYGLNQGFDVYDEELTTPILIDTINPQQEAQKVPPPADQSDAAVMAKWSEDKVRNDGYRPDAEVTDHAIAWLRAHHAAPFFLWVHYFGPHERLVDDFIGSHQEARIIADYDQDLQKTNAAIERLLAEIDALGLKERLMVVLHADHGQSLGEHNYVGHGLGLGDPSLRIPLLMRFPGRIAGGRRVPQLVRNVDILPTIVDELGFPVPDGLDGRSLASALDGQLLRPVPDYAETYVTRTNYWPAKLPGGGMVLGPMVRRGIRTERWKLIENTFSAPCVRGTSAYRSTQIEDLDQWHLNDETPIEPQECDRLRVDRLFDLLADPAETKDEAVSHPEVVERLRQVLATAAATQPASEALHLSPNEKDRLRRLGYDPSE